MGVSGWLLTLTGIVLICPQVLSAQHGPLLQPKQIQEFAWRAQTEAIVGKKVPAPDNRFFMSLKIKKDVIDCTIEARDEPET